MRAFAQKPKATPRTASARLAMRGRTRSVRGGAVSDILHLQRTIGNQAVQYSRLRSPIATAPQPGLVQRDKAQAARAKVVAAMKKLETKFGLGSVTEENGATWSERELAKVDAAFAKVAKEDQPLLKGLHLVRTDKFAPKVQKGKTFKVTGTTYGTTTIRLAEGAFSGDASTILHEVGHLINNRVAEAMLEKSKAKFDLKAAHFLMTEARKQAPAGSGNEVRAFIAALNQVTAAADDLLNSGTDDRAAKQSVLEEANLQADIARYEVERLKNDDVAKAFLELHDRQKKWVEAINAFLDEKGKRNLTGFIDIVTKHKLARKGFDPFTTYVAAHWPTEPQEYFAEAFHAWRAKPQYMKAYMRPLYDWFEKGGHRVGKGYLEGKSKLEVVREVAPVIYELGRELKETFWPRNLLSDIFLK